MKAKGNTSKWIIVLAHVAFWMLLFTLPLLLRSYTPQPPRPQEAQRLGEGLYYVKSITFTGLFYLNAYVLVPFLLYPRKHLLYGLSVIGALAMFLLADYITFSLTGLIEKFSLGGFLSFNVLPFLFFLALSLAYRMYQDRVREIQRSKERETEGLQSELLFLRSQISPHFLFNVLNNMVALARKKSDLLEPSLIKLSALLRYMLYETGTKEVSLRTEVEYLNSYIDLQRQRFGRNVQVHVSLQNTEGPYFIEPMLLIPFVENAFKHGTGLIEQAEIYIDLTVEEGVLHFRVKNRYSKEKEVKDKTSGIGLANVKRRLNILYKANHKLDVRQQDGWFVVTLQLNLH